MLAEPNSRQDVLILSVDDDDDFVFLLNLAWQRAQLPGKLIFVHNGVEAMDYLQGAYGLSGRPPNPLPDLVILDAHLTLLTGYQVLDWIRQQPKFRKLQTVILTGSEPETQAMRARNLGADGYYEKPMSMPELVNLVRHIYEQHVAPYAGRSRAAA